MQELGNPDRRREVQERDQLAQDRVRHAYRAFAIDCDGVFAAAAETERG